MNEAPAAMRIQLGRVTTILLFLFVSQTSRAVDPWATDLPYEPFPKTLRSLRVQVSSFFVRGDQAHLALGAAWTPTLRSRSGYKLSAEIGSTWAGSSRGVRDVVIEQPGLFAHRARLLFERRLTEASSLEWAIGASSWSALGEGLYRNDAKRKWAPGANTGLRFMDHFLPPVGDIADYWSVALNADLMSTQDWALQLELSVGLLF